LKSALDEHTLQFRLPEPFAPFLDYLDFGILPQHLLGDLTPEELIASQFNLEPVGSGPFRFDHLITADDQIDGVALTAFEDYYTEPPFIEQFVFRYFPDSPAALSAYQAGEVMGVSQVTREALPAALGEENLNLYSGRLRLA
jgi:peptide/nickel transport system substrate-binding protein